jgi:hypothetical protein
MESALQRCVISRPAVFCGALIPMQTAAVHQHSWCGSMQVVVRYSADTHLVSWAGGERDRTSPLGRTTGRATEANHWGEPLG